MTRHTIKRWATRLGITVAILTTSTRSSIGQTLTGDGETCEEPRRCFHPDDVNAAIDAACRRARIVEAASSTCVADLDIVETERDVARGALEERRESDDDAGAPTWVSLALRGVAVVGSGVVGYGVGAGLPGEVVVGFAVGAGLSLVVDVVLTLTR